MERITDENGNNILQRHNKDTDLTRLHILISAGALIIGLFYIGLISYQTVFLNRTQCRIKVHSSQWHSNLTSRDEKIKDKEIYSMFEGCQLTEDIRIKEIEDRQIVIESVKKYKSAGKEDSRFMINLGGTIVLEDTAGLLSSKRGQGETIKITWEE